MSEKMTTIQKQMITELLESGKCTGDFESKFMDSMKKKIEKEYSLSYKQNDMLQSIYDRQILGNREERTQYDWEFVTAQKIDGKHVWQLYVNGHAYGEPIPKGEALSVGLWLSKHLKTIAIDWEFDPAQRQAIAEWGENPENFEGDGENEEQAPF